MSVNDVVGINVLVQLRNDTKTWAHVTLKIEIRTPRIQRTSGKNVLRKSGCLVRSGTLYYSLLYCPTWATGFLKLAIYSDTLFGYELAIGCNAFLWIRINKQSVCFDLEMYPRQFFSSVSYLWVSLAYSVPFPQATS
jgi:hypothetical protein